jgi:membrane-bound serine protease (ClpP class)
MIGIIIALILTGFVFIILEIFLPGGVVGTVGALFLLAGSILCFREYGSGVGTAVLVGCLVGAGLIVYVGYKVIRTSPMGKRIFLESSESREAGYSASDVDLESLLGAVGVAASDLRPAGIADINDHRVSVVTDGEFVERGARVRVLEVESNRVVVERAS